jgi:hypothetical protein
MKDSILLLIVLSLTALGKIHAHSTSEEDPWSAIVSIDSSKTPFLQFTLRILPDNGWILRLYADSTYIYEHINMFSDSKKILESGKYTIKKEKLTLYPTKKDLNFKTRKYQLIEESTNKSMNTRNFGCDEFNDKTYCLYMK